MKEFCFQIISELHFPSLPLLSGSKAPSSCSWIICQVRQTIPLTLFSELQFMALCLIQSKENSPKVVSASPFPFLYWSSYSLHSGVIFPFLLWWLLPGMLFLQIPTWLNSLSPSPIFLHKSHFLNEAYPDCLIEIATPVLGSLLLCSTSNCFPKAPIIF